jgi:hypothetical protein
MIDYEVYIIIINLSVKVNIEIIISVLNKNILSSIYNNHKICLINNNNPTSSLFLIFLLFFILFYLLYFKSNNYSYIF